MAQLDTYKYFKDLKAGGVSDDQAEAEIRALQSALEGLATKEDLKNEIAGLEIRLNVKTDAVEAHLNSKMDSIEAKINAKIDSIKTIGWSLFAIWLAIIVPVFKIAFFP